MFKNDSFIKGFSIGLGLNAAMFFIIMLIIKTAGLFSLNEWKYYFLAVIPSVIVLRFCIKKNGCLKMGFGVLLSVIFLVIFLFIASKYVWLP